MTSWNALRLKVLHYVFMVMGKTDNVRMILQIGREFWINVKGTRQTHRLILKKNRKETVDMSSEADRLVDLVIGKGGFPGIVSIFLMKSGVRSSTEDLRGKANVNRTSLEVGE